MKSCRAHVTCGECGKKSHLTKFCVRKVKKDEGRVYAMDYEGISEDSDYEDDTAKTLEEKSPHSWSSDSSDTDEEENDEDYVNVVAENDSETSEEEDVEYIKMITNVHSEGDDEDSKNA